MALISDYYVEQNSKLHENVPAYGSKGWRNSEIVSDIVKNYQAHSILDYGCGKGGLRSHLGKIVHNYDPAIKKWSALPDSADVVVCADVMEHIEPECLHDVLTHIASLTRKVAFFTIACCPAKQRLPDNTNTHKIIEKPEWWQEKVDEYLDVVRIQISNDRLLVGIVAEPRNNRSESSYNKKFKLT